jgi:hypothetical protein
MVKKTTGEWRMCVDYRRLNDRMIGDAYPLPRLWDNLQRLARFHYYIKLDMNWGFWQLPIAEASKPLTSFLTHVGQFEFEVLPFGIKNSPSEFQRAVDSTFSDFYHEGVFIYIDDIAMASSTKGDLLQLFGRVLQRCTERGVFIKLKKCDFMRTQLPLLGHIVSAQGIAPQPRKVLAIRRATPPKSKAEVRSFLGAAGYLRRFVPHFAGTAAPLLALLKKHAPFVWGTEQIEAFTRLKELLCEEALLAAPQGDGPFVLTTDASDKGIGAALLQVQGSEFVILEYASAPFTPAA